MRYKIFLKIALIILIVTIIFTNNMAFANDNFDFDKFEKTAETTIKEPVKKAAGAILSVVRIAGTGIAIIILAVIAMKYLMAAPGDRADFKKGAIQYVIGAIIVFGAANILGVLIPVIQEIMD